MALSSRLVRLCDSVEPFSVGLEIASGCGGRQTMGHTQYY